MKDYINQVLQLIRKPLMESQQQPPPNNRQKQQQTLLDNPNNVTFSAQVVKNASGQPQQFSSMSSMGTSLDLGKAGQAFGGFSPNNNTANHAAVNPLMPTTAPKQLTMSDNQSRKISQSKLMTYYTDPIMHIDYDRIRYPKHPDAIFD